MSKCRQLLRVLSFGAILMMPLAGAQTVEQLRQLDSLTPEQRERLLEALGSSDVAQQAPLSEPVLVTPRPSDPTTPDDTNGSIKSSSTTAQTSYPAIEDLDHFGYDLFAGEPTTFAPATDIPVPIDYVVGPGDTIEIQLFGGQNALYSLVVGRNGILNVPEIGPVSVVGLQFRELTELLQQRVSEQMIGVRASITMGPLRSIRVFVLGDASRPGSYTVSSLSTLTNALVVSGGISHIGSLRRIQLKRSGNVVTTLDLYDLLLNGDTSGDVRLQPGDVIFVPPVGTTVGLAGEVRRPAIYELRNERSVSDLLELAGGMRPSAFPEASQISRISEDRQRTIIDVDLSARDGLATKIRGDDLVTVFSILEKREDIVTLRGHVYRPGPYQWKPGMSLTELVPSIREIRPKADLAYVMIRRENPNNHHISVLSTDLSEAFTNPGSEADVSLNSQDEVFVFDRASDREEFVGPIIEELRLQATADQPASEARIAGRVRAPGRYPLEEGMRVSDLVRAGGSLLESAYVLKAELTRYEVDGDDQRNTRLVTVDLAAALSGDSAANIALQPHDILTIQEIPLWRESEVVAIEGEVHFPGSYPIRRDERLSSLVQRAGGLTNLAFADGAVFLRDELRSRERQQIMELTERLTAEIESSAAGVLNDSDDIESKRALLEQVKKTEATGRLVIDLARVASGETGPNIDIQLRDGDRLLVPRESQTVTVIGEVQFPTSHVFEPGISRDDFIDRSGGTTALADEKRIYVVRANGSVVASRSSLFFRDRDLKDIYPGDTIVVPIEPDQVSSLSLWTSVTTIIYNIGVAAAAVASF